MMHFPPVSDFSPISQKISRSGEFPQFDLSPKKISDFHPPKFLTTFFYSLTPIFNFPPIFPISIHFPPISGNFEFPPYFWKNFPSDFVKFTFFLHTLRVLFSQHTLPMMHLCITQCTYWTPLLSAE